MSTPTYYVRGSNGCFTPAKPQPSAAPSQPAEPNTSTSNTMAGFRGGFIALHGRAPTEQEIWNAGVDSGRRRFGASHPAAEQAAAEGEREAFEAWAYNFLGYGKPEQLREGDAYISSRLTGFWQAWQAATARRPVRELTDAEITACLERASNGRGNTYLKEFAREIERMVLARATGEGK